MPLQRRPGDGGGSATQVAGSGVRLSVDGPMGDELRDQALAVATELRAAVVRGDRGRVEALCDALIGRCGDNTDVRAVCGAALLFVGEHERALDLLPSDAYLPRAKALSGLGRYSEALRACAEAGWGPMAQGVGADILARANSAGAAVAIQDAGIRADLAPLFDKAATLFRSGQVREAFGAFVAMFDRYEPWRVGAARLERLGGTCPRWRGERVGRLLVVSNGGSGDFFQFCRFFGAARRRVDRVTVCAAQSLIGIAERLDGVDEAVPMAALNAALQAADAYATTFVDLPMSLEETWGAPVAYLRARPGRVVALDPASRHVGLCWAASAAGASRSIAASHLARLRAVPGVAFHSLQVGAAEAHSGAWVGRWPLRDFEDTAGLIEALDAVVTVDTAVAHLAGAMGKPVHLILTTYEDWRWGSGERTEWYPSMHIHRGSVAASVARVAKILSEATR